MNFKQLYTIIMPLWTPLWINLGKWKLEAHNKKRQQKETVCASMNAVFSCRLQAALGGRGCVIIFRQVNWNRLHLSASLSKFEYSKEGLSVE